VYRINIPGRIKSFLGHFVRARNLLLILTKFGFSGHVFVAEPKPSFIEILPARNTLLIYEKEGWHGGI